MHDDLVYQSGGPLGLSGVWMFFLLGLGLSPIYEFIEDVVPLLTRNL